MGAAVTRIDPKTGENRTYYKGDDGKLYNDYLHHRQEQERAANMPGPTEGMRKAGKRVFDGTDAALNNVITDPSVRRVAQLGRDMAIESLPGSQRTNLDNPFANSENKVKQVGLIKGGDIVGGALQGQTTRTVGNAREQVAEYVGNSVFRKAGSVLAKKLPGIAAKVGGGTAGSGGLLAPVLGAWGAYDLADTFVDVTSGKPIHKHVEENLATAESTPSYYDRQWGGKAPR